MSQATLRNESNQKTNNSNEVIDLSNDSDAAKLEWVQLVNEMRDFTAVEENMLQRTARKFRENPLIPLGCFATTVCLTRGLYYMVRGDNVKQQLMMRGRVGAQAFTIAVFGVSAVLMPFIYKKKS